MSGGTVNIGPAANVINQSGGSVIFDSDNGVTVGGTGIFDMQTVGAAASSNTYHLDGGTLTVPQITSTATTGTRTFCFNGGMLKAAKANAAFMTGLSSAMIQTGLTINGVLQPQGTWGAIGSGAQNESAYFLGSGMLRVPITGGSSYAFRQSAGATIFPLRAIGSDCCRRRTLSATQQCTLCSGCCSCLQWYNFENQRRGP